MKISLRRRQTQTVKNGVSSQKTNYIDIFSDILNPEGHQNRCIGYKVTAILLNGWILPTVGASLGRVCACILRSRLVFVVLYMRQHYLKTISKLNCEVIMEYIDEEFACFPDAKYPCSSSLPEESSI